MDFSDKLKKAGKAVANGALWYLETASKSASKSNNFTDEQRDSLADWSENIHNFRNDMRNGFSSVQELEEEEEDYSCESDSFEPKTQAEIDCMSYNERKDYSLKRLRTISIGLLYELYEEAKQEGNDFVIEICEIELKRRIL